jgi:hypothetical protein
MRLSTVGKLRSLKENAPMVHSGQVFTRSAAVAAYWNVTVASARLTLSGDHKVTGPGAAPDLAILVP